MQSRIGTFCGMAARSYSKARHSEDPLYCLMQMSGAGVGAGFYAVHWNRKEESYSYNPSNPTATHVCPRRAKKLEQEPRRSSWTTCNAVLPGPKSSTKPTGKPLCLGVDRTADKCSGHLVSTYYVPGPRQSMLQVSDFPSQHHMGGAAVVPLHK